MDPLQSQSLFLCLPTELRLAIYKELLLRPVTKTDILQPVHTTYYEYESNTHSKHDAFTLSIRAEDPTSYKLASRKQLRSSFLIHSGSLRMRCMRTTYFLSGQHGLETGILFANAKIHAEATQILYSNYTFDFDTHVEAMVAFLDDLTPLARNCVRSIRIVKLALPYEREFDRAEWATAMSHLSRLTGLKSIELGVVAGKPGPGGWDMVPIFEPKHFELLKDMEGMEWIRDLLQIKGLESLEVDAVIEHCPPPKSEGMARFIQFSASVETSFLEYLREHMVG